MNSQIDPQLFSRIWEIIDSAQNILLHLHPSPDPDSAGSALAMYWVLKDLGKNPVVIKGDSDRPGWLAFLPGGLNIVDRNFTDINQEDFDLFIILDTSGPEQITKKIPVTFSDHLHTIVIDHHSTNSDFAQINLVDSQAPSTTQILYQLLNSRQVVITPQIAACLMAGLYGDTGGFKYNLVTSDTFRLAADLWDIYPDYSQLIFNLENQNEPENLKYLGLALSNIHEYRHLAMVEISYQQLSDQHIRKVHTEKTEISNMLKSVEGWMIGASFIESEKNIISISLRTRDEQTYNVGKIAKATGFGGGHAAAAGATLKMPFEQAKKFFLDTIYSVYPDLKPA